MNVIQSNIDQLPEIISLLSQHYSQLNELIGFPKYKTDESILEKHISERLSDQNSPYKYLSLVDSEGGFQGFVNVLMTKEIGEILVLLVKPEADTIENVDALYQAARQLIKTAGIEKISTEVTIQEENFKTILERDNFKTYLWSSIL